ncbi:MAG: hypothetical protein JW982_08945 [Spirochaetes bacterium]|nr:hypothetical protein [Spirochaetota bacterium]
MEVKFHANMYDSKTQHIANTIQPVFEKLELKLSAEYGGDIEHLWIDLELVERDTGTMGKPTFPFRFQKRVSGRSQFGLPSMPDIYNVGHLSVKPDYRILESNPPEKNIPYILALIYNELLILNEKKKKLNGFNSELFISNYLDSCSDLGYVIKF